MNYLLQTRVLLYCLEPQLLDRYGNNRERVLMSPDQYSFLYWSGLIGIFTFNRQYYFRERVQWRATRILPTLRNLSYEERLHHLNLSSLSYRQFRGDILTTFRYLMVLCILMLLSFLISRQLHIPKAFRIFTRHTRTDIRKRYFANRIIKKWNSLPSNIVEATSINDFKNKFDITLKTQFLYWSGLIASYLYL